MNNISIRKMRILLATAEEGNFTRAAMRENISQPAATIIINEIEETIGQELFVRQGSVRKAILTDMGRTVAETFSRIVAGYDLELTRIRPENAATRRVKRILVQSVFADAIDPGWLFSLVDLLAGEQLIIEEGSRDEVVAKISARNADVGLVEGTVDSQQCDSNNIEMVRVGLAVPDGSDPGLEDGAPLTWDDVPDACYVLAGVSGEMLRSINRNLSEAGKSLTEMNIINGMSALRAAARARPLPIVLPDVLLNQMKPAIGYRFHPLGPGAVHSPFSIIAPWGYMTQIDIKSLRWQTCFDQSEQKP